MTLKEFFTANPRTAVALSGGADSSYLLHEAVRHGASVKAYFVKTQFQPRFELLDAERAAAQAGARLEVITADILSCPQVTENAPDRCYHCKRVIFSLIKSRALEDGYSLLLDGGNASDDEGDRPGMRAVRELEVRSPLRECGITKPEVRRLSKMTGLFTWDKPAYSCLATRVPANTAITQELLDKAERSEKKLYELGMRDFRVRLMGTCAKLQVAAPQMKLVVRQRAEILAALADDFDAVVLDLEPRE